MTNLNAFVIFMLLIIHVHYIIFEIIFLPREIVCLQIILAASLYDFGIFNTLFLKFLIYLPFKSYCRIIFLDYSSTWLMNGYQS